MCARTVPARAHSAASTIFSATAPPFTTTSRRHPASHRLRPCLRFPMRPSSRLSPLPSPASRVILPLAASAVSPARRRVALRAGAMAAEVPGSATTRRASASRRGLRRARVLGCLRSWKRSGGPDRRAPGRRPAYDARVRLGWLTRLANESRPPPSTVCFQCLEISQGSQSQMEHDMISP